MESVPNSAEGVEKKPSATDEGLEVPLVPFGPLFISEEEQRRLKNADLSRMTAALQVKYGTPDERRKNLGTGRAGSELNDLQEATVEQGIEIIPGKPVDLSEDEKNGLSKAA